MTAARDEAREIRVVLDRSALESYLSGHVHVGEVITEVADDAIVGIPATTLLAAHIGALGNEHAKALLRLLVAAEGVVVLDLGAVEAARIAGTVPLVGGDLARAHAVWAANVHRALYLTAEPHEVKSVVPPENVLAIPADDI